MQPLGSILNQFSKKLQDWCSDLRILVPDLYGTLQDRCVGWVNPVEKHHVRRFGIECKSDSAKISGQPDDSFANFFGIAIAAKKQ